mgnify:CR=1 FL=1
MFDIQYPVYVFPAFTLKPFQGNHVAQNDDELLSLVRNAINTSPTGEVLIIKSLKTLYKKEDPSVVVNATKERIPR